MTFEIGLVLGLLAMVLALLITERVRPDVLALLVVGLLAVTGLVTPTEALAGFSNPAVITVWAMFMISEALTRTGVASAVGRTVEGWTGTGEARAAFVVMLTAGVLSAFMSNIGVAALMLPVVMAIARRTGRSPSRLLMPLAYGSLLGGLTTLVGTPPNLLAADALRAAGGEPFAIFDFSFIGVPALLAGCVFMALLGRRLLPPGAPGRPRRTREERLEAQYGLGRRTVILRVPEGSRLAGRTLLDSRLGTAAELSVFAVERGGRTEPLLEPGFMLQEGDCLLTGGPLDRLVELQRWRQLAIVEPELDLTSVLSGEVGLLELELGPDAALVGQTVVDADLRKRTGATLLALRRGEDVHHQGLRRRVLAAGDHLLLQAPRGALTQLRDLAGGEPSTAADPATLASAYGLTGRVFTVRVPPDSLLAGVSLAESRLGSALRLGVLGILREGAGYTLAAPDEPLRAGDQLVVVGERRDVDALQVLQELEVVDEADLELEELRAGGVDLVEAVVSPHAPFLGQTLAELTFRTRHGCHVLAVHRGGQARWGNLAAHALRAGDALLLLGPLDRLAVLQEHRDLVILTPPPPPAARRWQRALACAIVGAALVTVLAGWLPIAIAAVSAVALLILGRCLTMDQAYRSVEWQSIFLIAGMLPLGTAMERTGGASWLAGAVLDVTAPLGAWGALVGLYVVTSLATMIVPTAALVVIVAPIAIRTAAHLQVAPEAFVMAVALAASASFTSPISHPANLLVMGPGGYSFRDYIRVGAPLTIVVGIVVLALLPFAYPL